MRRIVALVVASAAALPFGCATIVGLEDHQLGPPPEAGTPATLDAARDANDDPGRAASDSASDHSSDDASDGNPCSACPAGYACIGGQCGDRVVEVAASDTHACAVLLNGELWCWGKNQFGELGVPASPTQGQCGSFACRPSPEHVPGISGALHVALGSDVTCVLDGAGAVRCFGSNARGQLGHDPTGDPTCPTQIPTDGGAAPGTQACNATPTQVAIAGDPPVAQIVAGGAVCARTGDKRVFCWGDDDFAEDGVLPIPAAGYVSTATAISGVDVSAGWVAFSATYGHGCGVGFFDRVTCWGSNVAGELGHAPGPDAGDDSCVLGVPCAPKAQGVPSIGGPFLAAGGKVSCVAKGDGSVWCWGANDAAQLGNGASVDSVPHPTPQAVVGLSNVVTIELRFQTGFAIDGAAHVFSWGYASDGALGVPASTITCSPGDCLPTPVHVAALDGAVKIASTAAGGVALKSDGSVWAWGINDVGELGHMPGAGDQTCRDGPCSVTPGLVVGLP